MTLALALAALAAWLALLSARDGYWRADQLLGDGRPRHAAEVIAIVPARDEAATIRDAVASLLAQDHAGGLTVVVVDDGSRDGTGALATAVPTARGDRRVAVVAAAPPPAGWSGKVAAQAAGLRHAETLGLDAPWLWLTDADIVHETTVLRRLLARAERQGSALVSVMVDLHTATAVERWLAPVFVHFFQLLYPFRAVNDPTRPTAAAAGGCILVEREALAAAGGFAAIHDRLIDDVALARAIKRRGHRLWLGLDHGSRSLRAYDLAGFWAMVRRTAFTELGCSYGRLVLALAGLGLLFVVPWLLVLGGGAARGPALGAVGLMSASLVPTLRWYGLGPWRALAFAPAAWAYMAMTVHSAWAHARGRQAAWRGRNYGA